MKSTSFAAASNNLNGALNSGIDESARQGIGQASPDLLGIASTPPHYLQLVDWTGRAIRDDKRGAIPAPIQPIFQRMGLNHEEWLEIVQNFGRRYRLAAAAVDRLKSFGQQLRILTTDGFDREPTASKAWYCAAAPDPAGHGSYRRVIQHLGIRVLGSENQALANVLWLHNP